MVYYLFITCNKIRKQHISKSANSFVICVCETQRGLMFRTLPLEETSRTEFPQLNIYVSKVEQLQEKKKKKKNRKKVLTQYSGNKLYRYFVFLLLLNFKYAPLKKKKKKFYLAL